MVGQEAFVPLKVEATLLVQRLPACACGERHPFAFIPARETCIACGALAATPPAPELEVNDLTATGRAYVEARAGGPVIVDRKARLGITLIRAGNALKRFAQRIAPND